MGNLQTDGGIQFLADHGLNLFAALDCVALSQSIRDAFKIDDVPLGRYSRLVLIGNGGTNMWDVLRRSTTGPWIDRADPVDDFSKAVTRQFVEKYLLDADSHLFYPGPSSVSLIQLGALANWSHSSPLGLGIHPRYGLWFAYRAAFLTTAELALRTEAAAAHPCEACVEKPCVSACPVGAVSATDLFDVSTCYGHRLQPESNCASQCFARAACPVRLEHIYSSEQIAHHYDLSLAM